MSRPDPNWSSGICLRYLNQSASTKPWAIQRKKYYVSIKCEECGNEISDKAAVCIKCGAPLPVLTKAPPAPSKGLNQKLTKHEVWATFIILFIVLFVIAKSDNTTQSKTPATCANDDLSCLGNKGIIAAGVYCKEPIEKLALHSVKWTDGTLDMKFSRFRWKDKNAGTITYIGDKVEFQNGFGAFTPMTYTCDLSGDNQTVIDVQAEEGRLP